MSQNRVWRKAVSVVAALALACTMCPAPALADEVEAEEAPKYVSLGASNVNGYGLRGYIQAVDGMTVDETYDAAAMDSSIKDRANVLGLFAEAEGSYPVLLAEELGYDLEQLAISSMRAEELRILLDNSYNGDSYSAWRFVGDDPTKWFNLATRYTGGSGGLDELRQLYQSKIAEADLVTVDIGANNFGVYISHQLTSGHRYDNDVATIDPALADEYETAKGYVNELIAEYVPAETAAMLDMDELVDTMAYALVGFCYNFDASMARIYELNPDAQVVAVSIQNLMTGYQVAVPGTDTVIPMGDLFGALVNAANVYIATGSPYADKYLCADVRQNGLVECFVQDIVEYDGNPESLVDEIRDCFDVLDGSPGNGYDRNLHVKYLVNKATGGQYTPAMLNAAYDAVASILQAGAQVGVIDYSAVSGSKDAENALSAALSQEITKAVQAAAADPAYDYVLPENFFANVAEAAGVSVESVETVASLYVRTDIGNTFFGHPNFDGHRYIADTVKASLENGTTGKDILDAEMASAISWLIGYAQEVNPEVGAVIKQAADYLSSEEFGKMASEMKSLYEQLDAAVTAEQKEAVLDQMSILWGKIQNAAAKVTSHKYVVDEGSCYVSLGDSSMTAYGLPQYRPGENNGEGQMSSEAPVLLAKKLFGEDYESHFKQLAKGGLRAEDMLYFLDTSLEADDFFESYTMDNSARTRDEWNELYTEAIKKADLITIGIGAGSSTTVVGKQIQRLQAGKEPFEIDWSTLVGSEAELTELQGSVESLAVALDGQLPEIMGVPSATLAYVVAESFVYGYASYFKTYPALLDKIHEINPDAHLVAVGYFNPIDDMVIPVAVDGETIEIPAGKYLGVLAEVSNAYGWAYAVENVQNTTFVAAPDAECFLDLEGELTAIEYIDAMLNEPWKTHSTQAGHEYVANQMYNMLQEDFLGQQITSAQQAYEQILAMLKQLAKDEANKAAQWLYDYVMENSEQVLAMLEQYGDEAYAYIQEHIDAILAIVDYLNENFGDDVLNCLMENSDEIMEGMVYLVENYGDEAWDMILVLVDASGLDEAIDLKVKDATTGQYAMDEESYYVALGDSNAAGVGLERKQSSYAELLADALGLAEGQFADLTEAGMRTEDLRAILDAEYQNDAYGQANIGDAAELRDAYVAEIEKADLITLSTGSDNLTTFVTDQLMAKAMGKGGYEMDWANYVGQKRVADVEALLAETNAYFIEQGLTEEIAELLTYVVECYAYGYLGFSYNYAEIVDGIHGVNPDAQVVLVGLFNPMDQLVIDLPTGEQFAFGEYVDYFVGLTDLQFTCCAAKNADKVTFVAVPETSVFMDELENSVSSEYLLELLVNSGAKFRPSAQGHEYIKAQILDAVSVTEAEKPADPEQPAEPVSIEGAQLTLSQDSFAYNGTAQKPGITVVVDGKTLVEGTDYEVAYSGKCTKPGTYEVLVKGMGNYTGQAGISFAIEAADLANAEIALSQTEFVYNGEIQKPVVTVTVNGNQLEENVDYELTYSGGCRKVGDYTVTIDGVGHCTGQNQASFSIVEPAQEPVSIKGARVVVKDVVYNAMPQTPEVKVTLKGKKLVEGTDFEVSYQDNVEVGTATAVVSGIDNYAGEVSAQFDVAHYATADSFKDFEAGAWYLSEKPGNGAFADQRTLYMDFVLAAGIMSGKTGANGPTGYFGPDENLTRAQAATMLFRIDNPDSTATTVKADYADNASGLTDVADGKYYTAAVNWCVEQGIVTGTSAGKFNPDNGVTREDLAVMLYRYCVNYLGVESAQADLTVFKDYDKIHGYAKEAMAFCVAEGILSGRSGGTMADPRGNATRCQAAKMFAVTVHDVVSGRFIE